MAVTKVLYSKRTFIEKFGSLSLPFTFVFCAALIFFLRAPIAFAATYTVDTTADHTDGQCGSFVYAPDFGNNSDCTIGEAFAAANTSVGADSISVPAGTYNSSITLTVLANEPLTVSGAGQGSTTIAVSGDNIGVEINDGVSTAGFDIENLTLNVGEPATALKLKSTYVGNFTMNHVAITGTPVIGIWVGADAFDGGDYNGNYSITNTTVNSTGSGIMMGLADGLTPTLAVHITGTLDITNNTVNLSMGSGYSTGIYLNSIYADGQTTINSNDVTITGVGSEGRGIIAVDFYGLDPEFSDTVAVNNNTITGSPDFNSGIIMADASTSTVTASNNHITGHVTHGSNDLVLLAVLDVSCFFGGTCLGVSTAIIDNNSMTVNSTDYEGSFVLISSNNSTFSGNTLALSDGSGGVLPLSEAVLCAGFSATPTCTIGGNSISGFARTGIATKAPLDDQILYVNAFNNLLYNGTGDNLNGFDVGPGQFSGPLSKNVTITADIYNNTMANIVTGTGSATGSGAIVSDTNDTGGGTDHVLVNAFNNIIANNANAFHQTYGGTPGSEDNVIISDYNVVYNNTADLGSNYNGITPGAHDITTDPLLTSSTDLHIPFNSPAVDAATAMFNSTSAPSVDFAGTSRPERDVVDRGAYEYVNLTPNADVGGNRIVTIGDTVDVHCTSTDPETDTIGYSWSRTSGPSSVSFTGGSTADASFTASALGTYVIRCDTNDPFAAGSNDSLDVLVNNANTAPTASAGADQYTSINEVNTLDCSASTDPEMDSLTYAWTQTGGTTVTLSSTSVASPTFTPSTFGDRTFQCQVTDPGSLSDTDSVVIHATAQRIAGASDRYDTAVKISQTRYPTAHTQKRLVITSGENYPDALTAGPLASLVDGPILLTQKNTLPSATNTEISRVLTTSDTNGSTTDIYVIGGTAAISDSVFNTIKGLHPGFEVKRIAGATDRIDTAIEIAKEMANIRGNAATYVAVASGYNYQDAAAMSAPASDANINSRRIPILLTGTTSLDSRVSSYLNTIKGSITKGYIVGSPYEVSSSAQTSIDNILHTATVTRLSSSDGHNGTAEAIANQFYTYPGPTLVSIVTSANFPDVLSAGPYAGSKHMALIYVTASSVPSIELSYIDAYSVSLNDVYVFGGTTVVPNSIKQTVQQHL